MTTPAADIRSYLLFRDSTDLGELQEACDAVKAIARSATIDNAMEVYGAKVEVLGALMAQYNRVSVAAKNLAVQ